MFLLSKKNSPYRNDYPKWTTQCFYYSNPILNLSTIVLQDQRLLKEQIELSTFEELEKNLQLGGPSGVEQHPTNNLSSVANTALPPGHHQNVSSSTPGIRHGSPDKHSRDSGVITPSEGDEGSRTSPEHSQNHEASTSHPLSNSSSTSSAAFQQQISQIGGAGSNGLSVSNISTRNPSDPLPKAPSIHSAPNSQR